MYICGAFSHMMNKQSHTNSSTLVQPFPHPLYNVGHVYTLFLQGFNRFLIRSTWQCISHLIKYSLSCTALHSFGPPFVPFSFSLLFLIFFWPFFFFLVSFSLSTPVLGGIKAVYSRDKKSWAIKANLPFLPMMPYVIFF